MIEVENLGKAFQQTIFENVSEKFEDRKIYALLGKSGSGKTTFLRILAGLDKKYTGTIKGNARVSYAFQEYRLFEGFTALENITVLLGEDTEERARATLSDLGFHEEDLMKKPSELSGGMKVRVSLARAAVAEGDVLLLDEPYKELDEEVSQAVDRLILSESKRRTVIFTAHEESDIRLPNVTKIHIG